MYGHILVPTDGSELAQKGVDQALALAKLLGSKVTIITATEPVSAPPAGVAGGWIPVPVELGGYAEHRKDAADMILAQAKAAAAKAGITADTVHVLDTWPADAIIGAAQEYACDLIVMASHGRRGIRKVLLGSQTSEVLVSSTIPVLVVR